MDKVQRLKLEVMVPAVWKKIVSWVISTARTDACTCMYPPTVYGASLHREDLASRGRIGVGYQHRLVMSWFQCVL